MKLCAFPTVLVPVWLTLVPLISYPRAPAQNSPSLSICPFILISNSYNLSGSKVMRFGELDINHTWSFTPSLLPISRALFPDIWFSSVGKDALAFKRVEPPAPVYKFQPPADSVISETELYEKLSSNIFFVFAYK